MKSPEKLSKVTRDEGKEKKKCRDGRRMEKERWSSAVGTESHKNAEKRLVIYRGIKTMCPETVPFIFGFCTTSISLTSTFKIISVRRKWLTESLSSACCLKFYGVLQVL